MMRARVGAAASRLRRSTTGASAVEFALVLPVMVAMYFGLVVLTTGYDLYRKVVIAARTAGDLTARAKSMSCADVTSNVGAAVTMVQPYDATGMTVALASVSVTNIGTPSSPNLQATVTWSQARSVSSATGAQVAGTLPPGWAVGSVVNPIPSGFAVAGTSFIMAKVDEDYTPVLATNLLGTIKLTQSFNWPARNTSATSWTGTTSCA